MSIYFVQGEDGGPIKIGYSDEVHERLKSLQTGVSSKLRLLAQVPGTHRDETDLHLQFDHLRLKGEWFSPADELREFIESLPASHDTPRSDAFMLRTWGAVLASCYGIGADSQRALCRDADVTPATAKKWLAGKCPPRMSQFVTLCRRNKIIMGWYMAIVVARRLSERLGISEDEALTLLARDPAAVVASYHAKSNAEGDAILDGALSHAINAVMQRKD